MGTNKESKFSTPCELVKSVVEILVIEVALYQAEVYWGLGFGFVLEEHLEELEVLAGIRRLSKLEEERKRAP